MRLPSLITRSRVPSDLAAVTTINYDAEVAPRALEVADDGVEQIWSAAERLYRSGIHPALQLCVRRHGEVLIDRAIGHAAGNGPHDRRKTEKVLATPATPFNILSASKAVTAMVIHLLDQKRLLHLHDPVCEYIPEFATHGKERVTIQHVLTHRAGIPNLPANAMRLENLDHEDRVVKLLCDAELTWRPGRRLAYHAITGGFILGEIVKRVTGKPIRTFLREQILAPLGFRWMNYGVAARDVGKVAVNYFTGPPLLPPLSTLLERALGLPLDEVIAVSNAPRFLTAVVPAGNVVSTANEMSRFYQLLLAGGTLDGVTVFEPRTIRRAVQEQSYLEFDLTLVLPLRYGMGFMLGGKTFSLYGPDTDEAFGHLGFTNIICWADPERQISGALMTSGKPVLYPEIYFLHDLMWTIGTVCTKTRRRTARARVRRRA
ncbi:MAG TPA: serine hydrolase domain-containing protein [Candidatus Dormibacteraeota bacterium]|nr:serine hydrolase domain-containing protein [Candidatus Dormibacteraeota bacterium]